MSADVWEGIVALVLLTPVGVACLVGAVLGPRRARVGRAGVVSMTLAGVGFLVIGIGLFASLSLSSGSHHVTLTVDRKVEVTTKGGALPPEWFVVTPEGRWYAAAERLVDALAESGTYTCTIDDEHYSGRPTPLRAQTSLRTCTPSEGEG